MSVVEIVKMGVGILILNLLHTFTVWRAYKFMRIPEISPDMSYTQLVIGLVWVLQRIVPPLFATQWLVFEIKALSRIFTGDDKFKPRISASGKPTVAQILDRCQAQSFEQTVMTMATCVSLALVDLSPFDLRLPVAWAWTYIVGRPLFVLGYLLDPKMGRIVGVLLGGFWMNMGALLYCSWVALGFSQSSNIAIAFYAGFLMVMTVCASMILPSPRARNARGGKKVR